MTDHEAIDAGASAPPIEADADALERAESDAAAEAAAVAPADPATAGGADEIDDVLTSNDYTVAFSPGQVAVGLAIVAGLVAFAVRRRRRARREDG
ncbi:MAG TPA: hypothetical protein VHM48_08710 [Candidatus Limnocylindrales bacterium]|nr:hypothetical protein [Candidatus Limnocylindrales bacterium]